MMHPATVLMDVAHELGSAAERCDYCGRVATVEREVKCDWSPFGRIVRQVCADHADESAERFSYWRTVGEALWADDDLNLPA